MNVCAGWLAIACTTVSADMVHLGTTLLTDPHQGFGGLSGIDLTADGLGFVAISDRGLMFAGSIVRDADGRIATVSIDRPMPLRLPDGRRNTPFLSDAEGVALAPDGTRFVSYEGWARIRAHDTEGRALPYLPTHPDFRAMQGNGSLEALALAGDGTLYVIPERSGRALRPFPVYRLLPGAAQWDVAFDIPRVGQLVPTGADIGPDGALYLLERDFNGFAFTSRIRRFDLEGNGTTLWQSGAGDFDNLEGLSVWSDGDGLRLTMISDDNFRRSQETQIVEFRLTQ